MSILLPSTSHKICIVLTIAGSLISNMGLWGLRLTNYINCIRIVSPFAAELRYVPLRSMHGKQPGRTDKLKLLWGNIQRYTPITVTQTAPFQTINLNIDLVVSMELIILVAYFRPNYQSHRKQTLSSKSADSTNHSQLSL